jgi:hypothetical protein
MPAHQIASNKAASQNLAAQGGFNNLRILAAGIRGKRMAFADYTARNEPA